MAVKKSVKKSTMVQELSQEELHTSLHTQRTDLIGYKRGLAAGELANPRVIGATRKEIARLMTALTTAHRSKEGEK